MPPDLRKRLSLLCALLVGAAWTSPAEADCRSSGSRCTPSEVIAEQAASEGSGQRAEWWRNRRKIAVEAPVVHDPELCIPSEHIRRQCGAIVEVARDRWNWSDQGWTNVVRVMRGGPSPRCFTSKDDLYARIMVWASTCPLPEEVTRSLLGEKPGSKKSAAPAAPSKPKAPASSPKPSPFGRRGPAPLWTAKWTVTPLASVREIRAPRAFDEDARTHAREERAALEAEGIDLAQERRRCLWGSVGACARWRELATEPDDLLWAYTRECEVAKPRQCVAPSRDSLRAPPDVVDAQRCDADPAECVAIATSHLDPGAPPPPEGVRRPELGRLLALRACESGDGVGCGTLDDAIRAGTGGPKTASARESHAIRTTCKENRLADVSASGAALCARYPEVP